MIIRNLETTDYLITLKKMQDFTIARDEKTEDETWLLEHPPTFTHTDIHHPKHIHGIPVVPTDRGGQITYHGPGQLIIYTLIDLKRKKLGPREFVTSLENSVLRYLKDQGMTAHTNPDAPGIYVDNAKIASLGLRIKNQCTYHGLALNVDMDLAPFSYIHPCGVKNQPMTQLKNWVDCVTIADVKNNIVKYL